MTGPANPALQVSEARNFQKWFWRAQRVAWVLLGLLLVAAAAGLTGGRGYYTQQTARGDGLILKAPWIMRKQAAESMTISLVSSAPQTGVHFDTAFAETFNIVSMTPQPVAAFATARGAGYRFERSGQGAKNLHVAVTSDRPGWANYSVVVDGHMAFFSTLVLP